MSPRRCLPILLAALALAPLAAAQPVPPPPPAESPHLTLPAASPPPASVPTPAVQDTPAAAPAAASSLPWPRVEQIRRGNRVAEVRVSSSSGEHRYTMVNREGLPPLSSQELSSGLSTPNFLRLNF